MINSNNRNLKQAGLKLTLSRLKILQIFEEAGDQHHFSAEEVYKLLLSQGEETSLATVYRVLSQFEAAGILKRRNFENNLSVFEINTGDDHDHIVCLKTGEVNEFSDSIIEKRIQKIAEKANYTIEFHELVIYGIKQNK